MLSAQLIEQIQSKIDEGDEFLNADDFAKAADLYRQALSLIPEPKYDHDITLNAYTALGEAHLFAGEYEQALDAFRSAMKAPGGVENPLTHLRLGQAYYESGDRANAAQEFTIAYGIDGEDIFEDEDPKYLAFLATQIEL
jgi:tetratricopeptide (TPR) repeat protein